VTGPGGQPLRVGIVGSGFIGQKRAAELEVDRLVATYDSVPARARELAAGFGARATTQLDELLALDLDVVVVAVTHDRLAQIACAALESGAHVLLEKPGGIGVADIDRVSQVATAAGRRVHVGFNHRFYPGIAQVVAEAHSGRYGPVMSYRARYGHGGRVGYDQEWRSRFDVSGGGELVDQGMHLLDISYWLMGPLPVHSALVRTNFWEMEVEDNAAVILGQRDSRDSPWGLFHVTWTEWKNLFSLEIYCRTAKLRVDGLARSYGPQTLRIYAMKPEMGPPDVEEIAYPPADVSWSKEWAYFRSLVRGAKPTLPDTLDSARYAWSCIEGIYADPAHRGPGASDGPEA
jgi:predicted dehydrogenase